MAQFYIVVSESIVGSHSDTSGIGKNVSLYNMTFPVTISAHEDKYYISTRLTKNDVFMNVLQEYNMLKTKKNDVSILASFDLDENGEIMAEALLDNLVHAGVNPYDIFRVPLTENGYMAIKQFADTSSYKSFLYHQQQIQKQLKQEGLPRIGIHKIFAIKRLINFKGREFDIRKDAKVINPDGTSTATFVHKFIQQHIEGEKYD